MKHTFIFAKDNDKMPSMIDCKTIFENSLEHLNAYKVTMQIIESYTNKVLMNYEVPGLYSRQSIVNLIKDYKKKNNDIQYLIKNSICGFYVYHSYSYAKENWCDC